MTDRPERVPAEAQASTDPVDRLGRAQALAEASAAAYLAEWRDRQLAAADSYARYEAAVARRDRCASALALLAGDEAP